MNEEFDQKPAERAEPVGKQDDIKTEPDNTIEDNTENISYEKPIDIKEQRIPEEITSPNNDSKEKSEIKPREIQDQKIPLVFGKYVKKGLKEFFCSIHVLKIADIFFTFFIPSFLIALIVGANLISIFLMFMMARHTPNITQKMVSLSSILFMISTILMIILMTRGFGLFNVTILYFFYVLFIIAWTFQSTVWVGQLINLVLEQKVLEIRNETPNMKAQLDSSNINGDSMISHNMSKVEGGPSGSRTLDITLPEKPLEESPQSSERQQRKIKRRNKDN